MGMGNLFPGCTWLETKLLEMKRDSWSLDVDRGSGMNENFISRIAIIRAP